MNYTYYMPNARQLTTYIHQVLILKQLIQILMLIILYAKNTVMSQAVPIHYISTHQNTYIPSTQQTWESLASQAS